MDAGGHGGPPSIGENQADVAPGFVFVESVERMAAGDAGFAAGAGIEIDLEGVLFAGAGGGERDELRTRRGVRRVLVGGGEAGDGGVEATL